MKQSSLITKLGLALLGQALPDPSVLKAYAHAARSAVYYSVLSAVLFSALALSALYGLHFYMLSEGASLPLAVGVPALVALLLAIICYQRASRSIETLSHIKSDVSFFAQSNESSISETLLYAFLEGLKSEPEPQQPESPHEQHEKIILVKD